MVEICILFMLTMLILLFVVLLYYYLFFTSLGGVLCASDVYRSGDWEARQVEKKKSLVKRRWSNTDFDHFRSSFVAIK